MQVGALKRAYIFGELPPIDVRAELPYEIQFYEKLVKEGRETNKLLEQILKTEPS